MSSLASPSTPTVKKIKLSRKSSTLDTPSTSTVKKIKLSKHSAAVTVAVDARVLCIINSGPRRWVYLLPISKIEDWEWFKAQAAMEPDQRETSDEGGYEIIRIIEEAGQVVEDSGTAETAVYYVALTRPMIC